MMENPLEVDNMPEEDNNPFKHPAFEMFAQLHERNMTESQNIQNWLMDQKDKQIAELEAENEELRERLCRIERRMMASLR